MAELCPTGHEDSPFFLFLFMQRLPKELRIVLLLSRLPPSLL
jgi:hypothetical protein